MRRAAGAYHARSECFSQGGDAHCLSRNAAQDRAQQSCGPKSGGGRNRFLMPCHRPWNFGERPGRCTARRSPGRKAYSSQMGCNPSFLVDRSVNGSIRGQIALAMAAPHYRPETAGIRCPISNSNWSESNTTIQVPLGSVALRHCFPWHRVPRSTWHVTCNFAALAAFRAD